VLYFYTDVKKKLKSKGIDARNSFHETVIVHIAPKGWWRCVEERGGGWRSVDEGGGAWRGVQEGG
jgi:hypothetical protein